MATKVGYTLVAFSKGAFPYCWRWMRGTGCCPSWGHPIAHSFDSYSIYGLSLKAMYNTIDFCPYGYRIERQLGANRSGGRVTYLALDLDLKRQVVIKQFQFAQLSTSWSGYDNHQREIEVLRGLNHPGIPRYLNSFQTPDGFCMVQEYKDADPLSAVRSFSPQDLGHIAVSVLEILVYLQNRIPPIIHRDLKPDNILVDDNLNLYLVDFGFARIGDGEVGVSSVVKGTLGFMPPEQLFNRELTEASDLYGLGMTLICLLTATKADDIGQLVDISYKVKFKHLVPKVSQHWVKWLEKMVEPRDKDRFSNAKTALAALPATAIHPPEVRLSQAEIHLKAHQLGEILSADVVVSNPVPEATLSGVWNIEPNSKDGSSPLVDHPWVKVTPFEFSANKLQFHIEVDTRGLVAGATYRRALQLHTNAFPQVYTVPLFVETAPLPVRTTQPVWLPLLLLLSFTVFMSRFSLGLTFSSAQINAGNPVVGFTYALGNALGLQAASWTLAASGSTTGVWASGIAAIGVGVGAFMAAWMILGNVEGSWALLLAGLIPGLISGWGLGLALGIAAETLTAKVKTMGKPWAIAYVLCIVALGFDLSLGLTVGFQHPWLLGSLVIISLVVLSMVLHAPLSYTRQVANFRRTEGPRIQP
ncbi:MAG: serine/threonine protein kinase [Leptolyngbya sp. DLM2.Bin15]|nr:MAG: serine/threonine protein kinase [Leptolyngbya sp. DLM2.Bin15]